jgi:hypothetical protein
MVPDSPNFTLSLVTAAVQAAWSDMGTNGLGWLIAVSSPIFAVLWRLRSVSKGHRWTTFISAWKSEIWETLAIFLSITLLIVSCEFCWNQPHQIWKQAAASKLPIFQATVPLAPLDPDPPLVVHAQSSAIEPRTPVDNSAHSESQGFAVAIEVKLMVMGPEKDTAGTGSWGVSRNGANCYLRSADVAMLLRIKSLEPIKTMITAYNIYGAGGEYSRIKMTENTPVEILYKGTIRKDFIGRVAIPVPAPSGNLGGGFVDFNFANSDFSAAAPILENVLDQELADHYLEPGETVRGWAFFEYPSIMMPTDLKLKISDDLGHTFTFPIPDEPGNPSGDALRREMTFTGPPMDLSSCIRLPHAQHSK